MQTEILNSLRRLEAQIERLDSVVRGNNGEGLVVRVARLHERHDSHAERLDVHANDLAEVKAKLDSIDRRVMYMAGGAAAFGGFLGMFLPTILGKWL